MLSVVRDTIARIHWRHNYTGRALPHPANDTAADYWQRMSDALFDSSVWFVS